jgi:preprotein translocase subunit SecA
VQEASGASVNASGLFIGSAVGDYHAVATSTADTAKTGSALIHVRDKTKDKEKEKEKDKEKEIREKLRISKEISKEIEILPQAVVRGSTTTSTSGTGRAFISPTLRPSTP